MAHQYVTIKFDEQTWSNYIDYLEKYDVNTYETHHPEVSSNLADSGIFPSWYSHSIVTLWGKEADLCVHELKLRWG